MQFTNRVVPLHGPSRIHCRWQPILKLLHCHRVSDCNLTSDRHSLDATDKDSGLIPTALLVANAALFALPVADLSRTLGLVSNPHAPALAPLLVRSQTPRAASRSETNSMSYSRHFHTHIFAVSEACSSGVQDSTQGACRWADRSEPIIDCPKSHKLHRHASGRSAC